MLLMPQKNRSRSGFMLLMLIAFTSIILGLATTFYFYCKRSQDDGSIAVKLVNQRLALTAALDYIVDKTIVNPPVDSAVVNWAAPISSKWGVMPSAQNPFNPAKTDPSPVTIISLKVNGFAGSTKLGWFRISYPYFYDTTAQSVKDFQYYFTGAASGQLISAPLDSNNRAVINSFILNPLILQNCVLVAVGCGPSQGVFSSSTDWSQEMISWYLVELNPVLVSPPPGSAIPGSPKHVIPLFPPPQMNTPTQSTSLPATPFYW